MFVMVTLTSKYSDAKLTYLVAHVARKMVGSNSKENPTEISKKLFKFSTTIKKIPEFWKGGEQDFCCLPCSNDYSLVSICHDWFKILERLYDTQDLRKNVLNHIKKPRKYYTRIAQSYLAWKKLSLVTWLAWMLNNDLPADEVCLYACGMYLDIHITFDYHLGIWTTLNLQGIKHDLVVSLPDIHLAYKGSGTFSYLCKIADLKTKARKLLHLENFVTQDYKLKNLQIKLVRLKDEQKTNYQLNDLCIKLTKLNENKLKNVKLNTTTLMHRERDVIYNTTNDSTDS